MRILLVVWSDHSSSVHMRGLIIKVTGFHEHCVTVLIFLQLIDQLALQLQFEICFIYTTNILQKIFTIHISSFAALAH